MEVLELSDGIYKICRKIMNLVYLNFLWIFFSILGLLIFGVFPATVALFSVCRQLIRGDEDIHITTFFWTTYKKEFIKANSFGVIFMIFYFILYIDFFMIFQWGGFLQYLFWPLVLITLILIMITVFFFPVYVHFQLSYWQYFKQAFLCSVVSPMAIIAIVFYTLLIYILFNIVPGAIPLIAVSLLAMIMMHTALNAFNKIARQQRIEVQSS